jgi:hypothetical protein
MKRCFEIHKCTSADYLCCSAKMSMTNCWLIKNGCMCRKQPGLKCEACPIYNAHKNEILETVIKAQKSETESIEDLVEEYSRFVYQIGKKFFLPEQLKKISSRKV